MQCVSIDNLFILPLFCLHVPTNADFVGFAKSPMNFVEPYPNHIGLSPVEIALEAEETGHYTPSQGEMCL